MVEELTPPAWKGEEPMSSTRTSFLSQSDSFCRTTFSLQQRNTRIVQVVVEDEGSHDEKEVQVEAQQRERLDRKPWPSPQAMGRYFHGSHLSACMGVGSAQHNAEVERVVAALQDQGRTLRLFEKCPSILAVRGQVIYGVVPMSYKRTRTKTGKWRYDKNRTNIALRRRYAHLDGVHIYQAKGTAAKASLTDLLNSLEAVGWRIIRTQRKVPDGILLRPDGKVVAIEALGVQPTGARSWTIKTKRDSYSMFDEVHIEKFVKVPA